jgi:hypothetical protein
MKLHYAGAVVGEVIPSWVNFLYNCTRNKKCQRRFDIPITGFSDLQLYVDLPGKPTLIEANVIALTEIEYPLTFTTYVVGQQPSNAWYGVFGGATPVFGPDTVNCFFIRIIFTIGGTEHVYYSEQFSIEQTGGSCDPLTYLQACYPNVLTNADARDCNGVYYGFHGGTDEPLGEINYRYFHWAYVRMGDITESKAKLTFTLFNNRTNYKTLVEEESQFIFELVPAFYKKILLGVFALGNIRIGGVAWTLAPEQDFAVVDNDSKLWKMDVLLSEKYCEQSFDCGDRDCGLIECCDPEFINATVEDQPEVSERLQNINTGFTITGIFTFAPPYVLPANTRAITVAGGLPVPSGQQRDCTIHPDHENIPGVVIVIFTDVGQIVCTPPLYLKVTDSDSTVECGSGNCLVQVIQTTVGQRFTNAEGFTIRFSNEVCP